MQKVANRPKARPYAGLPDGQEEVVTTQTVNVWRDKVIREQQSRDEWFERWGPSFGLTKPPEPEPSERRPIRSPAYPPPPQAGAPRANAPAPLPMNLENKRGPRGANLAFFCIPNSYYDEQVLELAQPYGNVVFCSVVTHKDTGLSRGYAFVSYETVAEADAARAGLHDRIVEGRAVRCELTKQDKAETSKPY